MKILVNTRHLIKDKIEGIGIFTFETFKKITIQHPEHEFIFVFDRKFDKEFIFSDNIKGVVIGPPVRHPILFKIWFEFSLRRVLKKEKPDLFISPDSFISLKSKIPTLSIIHDLSFEHYPDDFPKVIHKYLIKYSPKFANKATRIATVSNFSKNDIVEKYKINPNKIDVVYNGSKSEYQPINDDVKKQDIKNKYTKGKSYFLYLGTLHPRKNLINLFKGYDLFRNQQNIDIKLLIVGRKMWWTDKINKVYKQMKFKEDVIFTGYVSTEDLSQILPSALALTYVSYFEGFGIPLLEAFNAGIPVITSNCTSLPEVADNAALIVNPFSSEDIAVAMSEISTNESLRKDLIDKGFKRAKEFSWQKTADLLWESILKTYHIAHDISQGVSPEAR